MDSSYPPGGPRQDLVPASTAGGYPAAADYNPRYQQEQLDSEGGSLLEYWNILRRRKGTVILVAFFGLLISVLITLPQTPVYQARASLEIQNLNQDFMNMRQNTPISTDSSMDSWSNDVQTHIKLLQSDTLLQGVIDKLNASGSTELTPRRDRIAAWRKALNLPEPKPIDARQAALDLARSSLKLRAAGQTRVVEVLCDSTDAKLAAQFANTLAELYIDQSMEARWKMNQRTAEFLSRQLDEMRIKLEHGEDRLQSYARQAGLVFTGGKEKQNVSEEKLRQLQSELSKVQADRVSKQSRYEMAMKSTPEALPDVLNDVSLRDYQTKLTDLRRQEAELSATYKPEYTKVKRVQAQIASLQGALVQERKAILERIRNDYDEAQRREKLLADDYAAQAKLVTNESEKSIQYNILKREVDSTRQLYESMLQRVKESSIASAMRASNVRVVDVAQAPKVPYKPRLWLNSLLGAMSGIFLGIAFVVVRERADRSIQGPGDAPFWLNIPELGVIPSANAASRRALYYTKAKSRLWRTANSGSLWAPTVDSTELDEGPGRAKAGLGLSVPVNNGPDRVELVSWQRKPSEVAEAFRVVLTSILFSGGSSFRPRTLVLTSASPAEGKTTVVCNLAIALAEIRRKVLVIDADMRKPRIHDIFDLENERGLSTLLREGAVSNDVWNGIVQETAIPGLFGLPSGPASQGATNLLYSANLEDLLEKLKEEFDTIIIDTPPMLHMPDARVIGKMADAVILVTRAGQTTRDAAVAASQRLLDDRISVLGTILNDWNPKRSPGGYYGYHGGSYYRG